MSASTASTHPPSIAASSPAAPTTTSSPASSATVATTPAPPATRSSYANATKKISDPIIASSAAPPVVGGPHTAHHGKSASASPVNGASLKPAVPTMPAIVSGGPNGGSASDHSRKSSVHIKQTPPTAGPPSGIKFGSLAASPAPVHATPALQGALNPQASNPRIASPAHSPSPIPTPISGGPKPDGLPTRPNLIFGGQGGDSNDANVSFSTCARARTTTVIVTITLTVTITITPHYRADKYVAVSPNHALTVQPAAPSPSTTPASRVLSICTQ